MELSKDMTVQVPLKQYFIAAALISAPGSKTNVAQTALTFHSSNADKVVATNGHLEPGSTTVEKSGGYSARLREDFSGGENHKGHQIPWIA
jgi:hypothetical protein